MGNPWKVLLRSLESTALRAFYNVTRSRRALARYAVSVVALAIEKMNLQPSRSNPFSGAYATGHIVLPPVPYALQLESGPYTTDPHTPPLDIHNPVPLTRSDASNGERIVTEAE